MYEIKLVCGICGGDVTPDETGAVGKCAGCGPRADLRL